MIDNLKALIVVLAFSLPGWWLAKFVFLRLMPEADFLRRRNLWLILTVVAFISPSFWIYVAIAGPLMYWAGKKDSNPLAMTLLLFHVIPPLLLDIPTIVVNQLFNLNNYRLIAFSVLLPFMLRLWRERRVVKGNEFKITDFCVFGYLALTIVLQVPYESLTHSLRRSVLAFVDFGLLYYVSSRGITNRKYATDALVSLALGAVLVAPIAVFEMLSKYFIYAKLATTWGGAGLGYVLMREDMLRAQVAAGHPLALGYVFAMALGAILLIRQHIDSTFFRTLPVFAAIVGMIAALSRGPWIVGALCYLTYYLLAPVSAASVMRRLAIIGIASLVVLASPYGEKIIDYLPFVGTVDAGTVDYRRRLADISWLLIQQSPFFGNPFVLSYMESMRQGEGIIDLVNCYAVVALYHGGVGLALFLGAFSIGLIKLIAFCRSNRRSNPVDASTAAALAACMIGTLVMLAIGSLGTSLAYLFWVFSGLGIGVIHGQPSAKRQEPSTPPQPSAYERPRKQSPWGKAA